MISEDDSCCKWSKAGYEICNLPFAVYYKCAIMRIIKNKNVSCLRVSFSFSIKFPIYQID